MPTVIRPVSVIFTTDELVVTLADGRKSRLRWHGIRGCAMPMPPRVGGSN